MFGFVSIAEYYFIQFSLMLFKKKLNHRYLLKQDPGFFFSIFTSAVSKLRVYKTITSIDFSLVYISSSTNTRLSKFTKISNFLSLKLFLRF